jgi:hypothetical protein
MHPRVTTRCEVAPETAHGQAAPTLVRFGKDVPGINRGDPAMLSRRYSTMRHARRTTGRTPKWGRHVDSLVLFPVRKRTSHSPGEDLDAGIRPGRLPISDTW